MIIDSHVHSFPFLGGASGFDSVQEHMDGIQRQSYYNVNATRRVKDDSIVDSQTLWNGRDLGPEGLLDVNMRTRTFGQLEWTPFGDEDVYVQLFAPSLKDNEAPPEYVIAEMDYAGVDIGVLQTGPTYGRLNDYLSECVQKYPDRFIALGQIDESMAHTDTELSVLHRCVHELGMKGIFYSNLGFWKNGYRDAADDEKYNAFWDEVDRLDLIIYWDINVDMFPPREAYLDELRRIKNILDRNPRIPIVLVQALPVDIFVSNGRYALPDIAFELGRIGEFYFEIAYPISYGGRYDYPYRELLPLVTQLNDSFGPDHLVWGSDMPNVLRFCTYEQSYKYLKHNKDIGREDIDLILGGNLARLFSMQ